MVRPCLKPCPTRHSSALRPPAQPADPHRRSGSGRSAGDRWRPCSGPSPGSTRRWSTSCKVAAPAPRCRPPRRRGGADPCRFPRGCRRSHRPNASTAKPSPTRSTARPSSTSRPGSSAWIASASPSPGQPDLWIEVVPLRHGVVRERLCGVQQPAPRRRRPAGSRRVRLPGRERPLLRARPLLPRDDRIRHGRPAGRSPWTPWPGRSSLSRPVAQAAIAERDLFPRNRAGRRPASA